MIGTYNGVLLINGDFPATMPKLGFYIVYTERLDAEIPAQSLKIFFPGDEDDTPSISMDISAPPLGERPEPIGEIGPDPRLVMQLPIVLPGVILREKGRIRVRMYRGDEIIKLGALAIDKNSEQPNQDTPPPT